MSDQNTPAAIQHQNEAGVKCKCCSKCGETKPVSEFHADSRKPGGLRSCCKACTAAKTKNWRDANKEYMTAIGKAWREANKERKAATRKANYEANKDRDLTRNKAWREANKDKMKAHYKANSEGYIRRARVRSQQRVIRMWDHERPAINAFYAAKPDGQHVDHVIPLCGKINNRGQQVVSGLHVLANLQYLPGTENDSKGCRFDPEQAAADTHRDALIACAANVYQLRRAA